MCPLQQHVIGGFADPDTLAGAGGGGGAPGKPRLHMSCVCKWFHDFEDLKFSVEVK